MEEDVDSPVFADSGRRLVVVGQGYVGLPLAMRAVDAGFDVVGYDVDERRVSRLTAKESYVEDVSSEALTSAFASGRYEASSKAESCMDFDIAVITVPTPLREGVPDLRYLEGAARTLADYLRRGALVILESTSYPGTTEELIAPILEEGSGLVVGDFLLGYSPERIDPGNPVWRFENTPKIVSGVDEASLAAVRAFYDSLVEETIAVSGTREAELTKLLENTYRHVNIALINEMAVYAAELDIDIWQVIDAASTKPFGFHRFTPGPGVGGHCLPIDPSYLSWRVKRALGRPFRFIELANDINEHMPEYVVRRLTAAFNRERRAVNGTRILLLGVAYKKNSSDARESPAVSIASLLLDLGATVAAADPHIVEEHLDPRIERVEVSPSELAAADAVIVLTDHDDFDAEEIVRHARFVFDTRHCLSGENVEHL